jgi:hypothetical protein
METLGNKKLQKSCTHYYCEKCHYNTSRKSSYDKHLLSTKHSKDAEETKIATLETKSCEKLQNYECDNCHKKFLNRSGLWKHKNKSICCIKTDIEVSQSQSTNYDISIDKELMLMIINQNKELIEIVKNGTHNTTHNNSHNKAFNLNFFLNETCKDAMNIMDFVDSIKLQLNDLEKVGELGFVDGISNIIVKNLKDLDVTKRPVHCTDKKREVLYVKDENKWEKEDDENKKVRKAIKIVANKNIKMLSTFKEKHPDCLKSESKFSDKYNKLVIESFGGTYSEDYEKENKIIKKIS